MRTSIDEPLHAVEETARVQGVLSQREASLRARLLRIPGAARLVPMGFSLADQGLAVGGIFLANVALARTQSKEEYGAFALSYSVFIFLSGVHNAAILEPYTVYGSGRYREGFSRYLRLITGAHVLLGLLLSGIVLLISLVFWRAARDGTSRAFLGLGLSVGVLLSGIFLRRTFYVRRQPARAAKSSLVFFLVVSVALWVAMRTQALNSFSIFLIVALGWSVAGAGYARKLISTPAPDKFLDREPGYWALHWKYSRWVLATALVFQLMTQGYYWLTAAFLSVKDVGELRAMYNLVAPADQVFIAVCFVALPAMSANFAMGRMDKLLSLWKRFEFAVLGAGGLFALGIRIWGQRLMHFVYAGKFDGLSSVLFVLALVPVLTATGNTMALALNAAEKPRLVFYGYLASGVSTFALGIPLVIRFGMRGAAFGMLLSGSVFGVVMAIGLLFGLYRESKRVF